MEREHDGPGRPTPERPAAAAGDTARRGALQWLRDRPRWQLALLATSAAAVVVAGPLALLAGDATTGAAGGVVPGAGPTTSPGTGASTLLPEGTTGTPPAAASADEPVAAGVFRLGFSFLVGFSVGAFLRSATRLAAIVVGFFVVMMTLLEMGDYVTINWHAIDEAWSGFWARVGDEWGNFQRFLTGRLPAAGLTCLGLYAGIKRS